MDQIQRVAAYAWVVEDGQILLCRIAQHCPDGGKWTLPGGGIDFGEHPMNGVVREVLEETGLEIRPVGILFVDSQHLKYPTREVHALRIVYRAMNVAGNLAHELEGSTDRTEWIAFSELDKLPIGPLVWKAVDADRRGQES